MKPEAQRIAIAEWCGWKWKDSNETAWGATQPLKKWHSPEGVAGPNSILPDYLNDLNAMHEVEGRLSNDDWDDKFYYWIGFVVSGGKTEQLWEYRKQIVHSNASQRAEAVVRTIEKWSDE